MQMCCTSIDPKRSLGEGADLRILTAIKYTLPHAKSLHNIVVRIMSVANVTRAIFADFNSMKGGLYLTPRKLTLFTMRHWSKTLLAKESSIGS
jgi:hypothetical protein